MPRKHRHYWRIEGWARVSIIESCKCGAQRSRSPLPAEAVILEEDHQRLTKNQIQSSINLLEFKREFWDERENEWRMQGSQFGKAASDWVSEKECAVVVYCDDSAYATAVLIVFIRVAVKYWSGLTVIYIPQTGSPAEFNLDKDMLHAFSDILSFQELRSISANAAQRKIEDDVKARLRNAGRLMRRRNSVGIQGELQ